MKTTIITALMATIAITSIHADPLEDVGIATIVGGQKGGPGIINDNGRNAFVVGDGQGNGVIFQDKGPTYIQNVGGTTFIVPTGNQGRNRDCNGSR